ncbi:hypothetical protein J5837_13085 [Pseudoxanthomonas helianthi]|uniref:Uncharacterized protein n=1 Tax=Pseudoxanthomonas helianthi TaxID=1453541 RepID=A0A940X4U4_9GAMM|nr:hypothetical protein [Pseudoxanthomonas helianthi]MBP3985341.1 hypothetical protein [Pseudoxanthomonas helianthi]
MKIRLDAIDCNIKQRNASWQYFRHDFLCCKAQRDATFSLAQTAWVPSVIIPVDDRMRARPGAAMFVYETRGDASIRFDIRRSGEEATACLHEVRGKRDARINSRRDPSCTAQPLRC